jgi:hypothetical protein
MNKRSSMLIISGTIFGSIRTSKGVIILDGCGIKGIVNRKTGVVISIITRDNKLVCMLSNSGDTLKKKNRKNIDHIKGLRIEGVIEDGQCKFFSGLISEGNSGIYLDLKDTEENDACFFHNPGETRIITIP